MIRLMISISLFFSHTTRSCTRRWQSSLLKTMILLLMLVTVLRLRNAASHGLPGRVVSASISMANRAAGPSLSATIRG